MKAFNKLLGLTGAILLSSSLISFKPTTTYNANRTYEVEIETCKGDEDFLQSKVSYTGTDDSVYIKIEGKNGSTDFIELDDPSRDDFEAGDDYKYSIEGLDVGVIYDVVFKIESTFGIFIDEWYLTYVYIGDYYSDLPHPTWIDEDEHKINMLTDDWLPGTVFSNGSIVALSVATFVLIAGAITAIVVLNVKKKNKTKK